MSEERSFPRRSRDEPTAPKKKRPEPSAYDRVLYYLGRREHSQSELWTKLRAKQVPDDQIEAAIARAVEHGFQDDGRFVQSLVRTRAGSGFGPRRVAADLRQHRLDGDVVAASLDEEPIEWVARARAQVERKFGAFPRSKEADQKATAMLIRKGFSFDDIKKALRDPEDEA